VKAVVTGARGFVGRHLTDLLTAQGARVVALDVHDRQPVDITDRDAVRRRIDGVAPDVVFHLAARSHVGASWTDGEALREVNVEGTRAVVDACVEADVGRLLVVGSAEQYGAVDPTSVPITEDTPCRPLSPYGRTKVEAEEIALAAHRQHGLHVVCTRAFNHTGPGQSPAFLVPGLASRIAKAERERADEITLGNGDSVRDFSDVRDVVRAYALLAQHGAAGAAYNVCSGNGVRVGDVAAELVARAHRPLRIVTASDLVRPVDVPVLVGDPTKLVTATGWQAEHSLADTLDAVLASARADR
jgi:GDP-4-dehydro-6-deoxy-D-mannose reductase